MLSSEDIENGEKKIGLISKKSTLHVHHFFCTFLCRCLAQLQRETSRSFLVTRFMKEMSCMFLFTFLPLPLIFPWWSLAFLIFSSPLQNFHVVLPTKNVSFVFNILHQLSVAFSLIKLRWPVAYFLFCSVFLFLHFLNLWI